MTKGEQPHEPRIIVRIELTEVAWDNVERDTGRNGMTQLAMLSRVVGWFAEQPDAVRSAILGHLPAGSQDDVAREVLKRMAAGGR